jgi:hypothetical protein
MNRSILKALPFAAAFFSLALRAGWAADCNGNGVDDALDISRGTSQDCNLNSSPDECDLAPGAFSFELGPRYIPVLPDIDPSTVARFSFAVPELADLDADSDTDVVLPIGEVGLKDPHGISSRSVGFLAVYRNKGDGSLESPALYETGLDPRCMPPVDMDGDGHVDLVVRTTQSLSSQSLPAISVFLNRGDGTFAPRRTTVLPLPTYGYYSLLLQPRFRGGRGPAPEHLRGVPDP